MKKSTFISAAVLACLGAVPSFGADLCRYSVSTSDGAMLGITFEPSYEWAGSDTVKCVNHDDKSELDVAYGYQYINFLSTGTLSLQSSSLAATDKVSLRLDPVCAGSTTKPASRTVDLAYASPGNFSAPTPLDIPVLHHAVVPYGVDCPDVFYSCTYEVHVSVNGKDLVNASTMSSGFAFDAVKLQQDQQCFNGPTPQG